MPAVSLQLLRLMPAELPSHRLGVRAPLRRHVIQHAFAHVHRLWQRPLVQARYAAAVVLVGIDEIFVVEAGSRELRRVLLPRVEALVVPFKLLAVREVLAELLLGVPAVIVEPADAFSGFGLERPRGGVACGCRVAVRVIVVVVHGGNAVRGERDAAARSLVRRVPVVRAVDVGDARALASRLGLLVRIPRVDYVGVLLVWGAARVLLLVRVGAVAVAHARVRVLVQQRLIL